MIELERRKANEKKKDCRGVVVVVVGGGVLDVQQQRINIYNMTQPGPDCQAE